MVTAVYLVKNAGLWIKRSRSELYLGSLVIVSPFWTGYFAVTLCSLHKTFALKQMVTCIRE